MSSGDFSTNQNGPRSGTTTGFFIGFKQMVRNLFLKKVKLKKKKIARNKDAYKTMSMLRVHAYAC